ncbi:DUF1818 family protein [Thermostichus vulcanus]|uniref:DUF1818 family protein n=1 Tax=Thermostichus vulcanus str. 'Rupite' TaxID=2813851 RepID=A0ABT0C910_THEVL|nr:DUF1818 family protein [Thermostichus vulcanus]MCJ2542278.1 DUF1818 family protein [Thermostichus vulcanus str. 'Rupite']
MARSPLLKGSGWRLGWDPSGQDFVALVGGEVWALELTRTEWQDFVTGLQRLVQDMEAMGSQLMAEEGITLEQAFPSLTLIASGTATAWSLYLQLHQGRRGEGFWPASAAIELSRAVAQQEVGIPAMSRREHMA